MNIKEQAYQLHLQGKSYKEIGDLLGIGKTTAYGHVKEQRLSKKIAFVPNALKPFQPVPNRSERGLSGRSEPIPNERSEQKTNEKPLKEISPKEPEIAPTKFKEFTGDQLIKKDFITLNFDGKFLELIGRPSKRFYAVIWGLPKGGKSNLAIRFADYLQEYFGKVVYVAAEEGESATLAQKFKDIDGSKVTILETRNKEDIKTYLKEKDFDFVFIDSINNAGIDSEFLEVLKTENPNKSFIAVTQATKGGNFKGDQSLTHNCDFVIKVVAGIAYQEGRFSPASEVKIFDEPLYEKNKNKVLDKKEKADPLVHIAPNKVFFKPIGEAFPPFPGVAKSSETLNKIVLPTLDKDLFSKKTSYNFSRKNYSTEPGKNNGNALKAILWTGAALVILNSLFGENNEKDKD